MKNSLKQTIRKDQLRADDKTRIEFIHNKM
jgi:hypothetical protein